MLFVSGSYEVWLLVGGGGGGIVYGLVVVHL